jgi:membrane protease YdiL (CAAX protease family)
VLAVGLVAAVVVWRTRSLIAAMILHVCYNAVSLAQARELEGVIPQWGVIALGISAGLLGALLIWRRPYGSDSASK